MAEPSRSLQPATLSPTGWCCIDSLNLSNTPESGSPSTSRSRATSMAACMPPHRRGPGPLGEGQRRLVDRAGCRGHRHHRIRRTGSVPWLRQLRSRRAARRGHGARRVPCRQTRRQRLDEVRRRVQQATLGRRGHKDDPLYRIRRTLLTGIEHLTDRQRERLDTYPTATPPGEVELATKLLDTLHTCQIKEVARLGRTDPAPVAQRDTGLPPAGCPTARPKPSTASSRRPGAWPTASATSITHGFCNFNNYRNPDPPRRRRITSLPALPAARPPTMLNWEEPVLPWTPLSLADEASKPHYWWPWRTK